MAAFEYEALDAAGKRTRGLLSADSEAAARKELRRRRLAPLSVSRASEKGAGANPVANLFKPGGLSEDDLTGVTRQLATLIDAGMPVEEAVGLVGGQADKAQVGRVLMGVREKVTEGERLSDAMALYPDSFPGVYRAMVAAGESAGGLGQVLERLADYLEKAGALKRRVGAALIYPSVLGVVALLVVCVLLVAIVPKIAEQFDTMNMTLPLITRVMIALSDGLQASWPILLVAIVGAVLLYSVLIRREPVKRAVQTSQLGLPGLGGFARKVEAARFARTMAILINAGAVLPEALRAARRASDNLPFQAMLGEVIEQVETGKGLADALRQARWFPPLMVYMVAAGERSGRLAEMFQRSAEHMEAEVDGAITVGLSLLEPGIIIAMAVIVVGIVLSILLPILQLNTAALG
ncbi:type II secretion system inner membrane protein GspF [Oceanicaulis sp. HTCC2633]|uniref:type II secretion system inner membrane protein GspF n=1 Tax=Oceanicaulis sp. HTCC2633 TaxID=314254 RepID=UPI0002F1FD1E|nr:type II secretion system inner membrane protein GspF [Oceanicaulis sp. HTCC2633]